MGRSNGSGVPAEPPHWLTDTGRFRLEDYMHAEAQELLKARVPKWGPTAVVSLIVGLIGILGAVGAGAVAMERTKEIPALRSEIARHGTAVEVNAAEHRAILERLADQGAALKSIDKKLDRALRTATREP